MDFEKQIECILNNFNFLRVHEVMIFTDWKWANGRTPSSAEIKQSAKNLLRKLVISKHFCSVATGGLRATKIEQEDTSNYLLRLEFVLENFELT